MGTQKKRQGIKPYLFFILGDRTYFINLRDATAQKLQAASMILLILLSALLFVFPAHVNAVF